MRPRRMSRRARPLNFTVMPHNSEARYKYPMVRGGGAFLVCVGVGLVVGAIWPGSGPVNAKVLGLSAVLGILAIPIARRLAPLGKPQPYQVVVLIGSVVLEFAMFRFVYGRLVAGADDQARWLWALLFVGVHFLPMGFAFGKRIAILGATCILAAVTGLVGGVPFFYAALIDGALKVGFGLSMCTTRGVHAA